MLVMKKTRVIYSTRFLHDVLWIMSFSPSSHRGSGGRNTTWGTCKDFS